MARINYIARRAARIRAEQRPANVLAAIIFALCAGVFGFVAVVVAANAADSYAPVGSIMAAILFASMVAMGSTVGMVWAAWNARP